MWTGDTVSPEPRHARMLTSPRFSFRLRAILEISTIGILRLRSRNCYFLYALRNARLLDSFGYLFQTFFAERARLTIQLKHLAEVSHLSMLFVFRNVFLM